jgi:Tfp pilus assembly protein PilF
MIRPLRALFQKTRRYPGRALAVLGLLLLTGFGGFVAVRNARAAWQLREAKEALAQQQLSEALDHLDRCLAVWPSDGEAHLLAARTARRLGKLDLAEEHLERCAELGWSKDAIEIEQYLMEAQQGNFQRVENALRNVVIRNQDSPDVTLILEVLAKKYLASYRFTDAHHCLRLWLEREPNNLIALLWQSWLYSQGGDHEDAETNLRRAVKFYPNDADARLSLADVLLLRRKPKEALPHFLAVARSQGDAPAPKVLLGIAQCRAQSGQPAAARRVLRQLLDRHPGDAKALLEYAKVAPDERAKEKWLRKALKAAPADPLVNYQLYLCLQSKPQRQEEARAFLTKFKSLDGKLKRIHQIIAKELGPTYPPRSALEYELGVLYLDLQQNKEAYYWLDRALEHNPHHRPTREALARYYARVGDLERAHKYERLVQHGETAPPHRP